MNLEEEAKKVHINTNEVTDIASKCNELLKLQKQVATAEEALKKLKEQERKISEEEIPNLMQNAGVSHLGLDDGTKVEVKPFYSARIPTSRTDEAFDWLRQNNFADLIKNNVSLSFNRGDDNMAKSLVAELREKGHNVKQAEKVEPMTLKAFVREQIEKGRDIPQDIFGVYVGNKTKLTTTTKE